MRRVLKWLGAGAATLGVMVGALAIYGASRPREHVARRTVELPLAPGEVFAILEDVEGFACWRRDVERVDVLPEHRFVEHTSDGSVRYAVTENVAEQRLVVRIDDEALPYGGAWTYELAAGDGGGTRLTITERGHVDNPVLRGLASLLIPTGQTIERFQADLSDRSGDC